MCFFYYLFSIYKLNSIFLSILSGYKVINTKIVEKDHRFKHWTSSLSPTLLWWTILIYLFARLLMPIFGLFLLLDRNFSGILVLGFLFLLSIGIVVPYSSTCYETAGSRLTLVYPNNCVVWSWVLLFSWTDDLEYRLDLARTLSNITYKMINEFRYWRQVQHPSMQYNIGILGE